MKLFTLITFICISLFSLAGKPFVLVVQVLEEETKTPIAGIPIEFRSTDENVILYRDTTDLDGKVTYSNCTEKYVWMSTSNKANEYSNYQNMLSKKYDAGKITQVELRNFIQFKELIQRKTAITPLDSVEIQKAQFCDSIDKQAEFIGGRESLLKYLHKTMQYPENAMDQGISGKCYLKFIVNSSGEISHIVVEKGVPDCPECDFEAMLAVARMPDWAPAECDGTKIGTFYSLPISFTIR